MRRSIPTQQRESVRQSATQQRENARQSATQQRENARQSATQQRENARQSAAQQRENARQSARGPALPDVPWRTKTRSGSRGDVRYSEKATDNLFILSPTDKKLRFRTLKDKGGRLSVVAFQRERQRQGQPQQWDFREALTGGVATSGLAGSLHGGRLRGHLEPALKEALEEIARLCAATSNLQTARRVRPQLWLRFGRLTFYSGNGKGGSESREDLPSCLFWRSDLEQEFVGGQGKRWLKKPSKVFNTELTERYFQELKEVAGVSEEDRVEKDFVVVKISKNNWLETLVCFCKVEGDRLMIVKIKRRPVRHLVADLSWATEWDLTFILSAQVVEGDETISDDERRTAEDTVKGAIIDPSAELGIRWPLSVANQSGDSGLIKRSVHAQRLRRTKIFKRGIVWRFTHGSDSEGLAWFHVDLRLVFWNSTLKDLHANKEQMDYSAKSKDLLDSTFAIMDYIFYLGILRYVEG